MKWLRNIVEDAVRLIVGQLLEQVLVRLDRIEQKVESIQRQMHDK